MNTSGLLRNIICVLAAAFAFLASSPRAAAQPSAYPNRPIRFIVPLPAGGGADIVARIISERLTKSLGQQVLVDNRPGGGTVIGADLAAKAPPDGYTLLLGTATTHAINASLVRKLPYDPIKDFSPITLVAVLPQIIVSHPSLPVASLKEFIALARKRPGEIFFASTGNGSANHLGGEMLNAVAGLKNVHVPYKGAAPTLTDLLAGQVQFMFTTIPPGASACEERQAARARRCQRQALFPPARSAHHRGERRPGRGGEFLERRAGACRHPARHHREAPCGDRRRHEAPRGQRPARERGRRTDAHHARRVRGLHRVRDRALCESRQVLRRARGLTRIRGVGEAADGREAVQLTQELKPDVVIMDITMRELGGRGESGRKENRRAV